MTTQRGLEPHEYLPYPSRSDGPPCRHCERGKYDAIHWRQRTVPDTPYANAVLGMRERRAEERETWPFCAKNEHHHCAGEAQLTRKGPPSRCGCSCHERSTQPAPSNEINWHIESRGISAKVYVCEGDRMVALASSEGDAEQIVRDHRLAALVPELVEALDGISDDNCYDACFLRWMKKYEDSDGFEHSEDCQRVVVVLNAANAKLGKE